MKKWIWLILLLCLAFFNESPGLAKEKVSLQLRWDNQFQFAGYYAAKWQGFYEQAGLEVDIRPAVCEQGILRAVKEVESGRADFGIGAADILKACDDGAELVVVASIFQHYGAAFYARQDSSPVAPADFLKLKVSRRIDDLIDVEFQVLMKAEGIDPHRIKAYPHQPGIDHLISGKVDLIPGYVINIPYTAKTMGYSLKEIKPLSYGIDFYGDSIFTSRKVAQGNPDLVKRFRDASIKGWKYALQNREEMVAKISQNLVRTKTVENISDFNRFQSETILGLIRYPEVEIGNINPDRWEKMSNDLIKVGLLKKPLLIKNMLFDPNRELREKKEKLLYSLRSIVLLAIVTIALAFIWIKTLRLKVAQQTTSLAAANERLQESENRFNLALKASQDGVFDWNLVTNDITYSRAWKAMLGYRDEELPNDFSIWENLTKPEDVQQSWALQQKLISKQIDRFEIQFKMKHKDGHWVDVLSRATAIFDESGKAVRIVGTHVDVSELKRAQEALKFTNERLALALEAAKIGIWEWSPIDGKICLDKHWAEKLGFPVEHLFADPGNWNNIIHDEDWSAVVAAWKDFAHGRAEKFEEEFRLKQISQEYLWVAVMGKILNRDEQGSPIRVIGTIQNINDRKNTEISNRNYEDQLRNLQKMESLGVLAGGIAHDFNNMLAIISGNVSYALEEELDPEKLHEVLKDIENSSKQAQTLTNQLLTFSKGGVPIKKPVKINELIKECAVFSSRGSKSNCRFNLADDLWISLVDEGQINQVVSNLVINADQAMPNGGDIIVSSENCEIENSSPIALEPGKYVKVSVADSGIGIEKENLKKVFDPYFSTKNRGSGLGLATVFSIIQKHGGHIEVESEPGKGTCFSFFLPASPDESFEQLHKENKSHSGKGKILVLEDQQSISRMLQRMLGKMGYETICADDGERILKLFKNAQDSGDSVHMVILDLTIPGGMGGVETMKELLRMDPQVKAIVSSGYFDDPIMANYKQHGFSGVIPKPYNMAQLSEVLSEIETDEKLKK